MRVAVLADIHGNLPALEAVLAEPDVADADRVVLLGDIALGPMPAESLDLLASLGERAVWVHGNCEREVVTAYDGKSLPGPNADGARATAALLERAPPGPARRAAADGVPRRRRARRRRCSATRRRAATTSWCWSTARWLCGNARSTGVSERARRRGAHAHAVRPAGRRAAGGEPGQRRHVVRRRRARAGHCSARRSSCAARRTTSRPRRPGSGRVSHPDAEAWAQDTCSRHRATPRRWRSSASWSTRSSRFWLFLSAMPGSLVDKGFPGLVVSRVVSGVPARFAACSPGCRCS